jgi:hypothetical protein
MLGVLIPSQCATRCSPMTRLAKRTSCRHDEGRALNTFNRAATFHTPSAQLAQLTALFFNAPEQLPFRFLA